MRPDAHVFTRNLIIGVENLYWQVVIGLVYFREPEF